MNNLEQAITDFIAMRRRQTGVGIMDGIPLIGEAHVNEDDEEIKRKIARACAAQIRWMLERPPFLPSLPLSLAEITKIGHTKLDKSGDEWLHVLAYYAYSWRQAGWDPEHPPFAAFTSALLNSPHVPWHLHTAAALSRIERKPLADFNNTALCWEPLERGLERIRAKITGRR
jgi:hypothetical protein